MRTPGRAVAFCSIALFASFAARAEDISPQDLLRRMSVSLRRVDFQGSFIYQHDGRTDALRIFHDGGDHERERLISLTGARGEIVRDDHTITCVQSGGVPTLFANRAELRLLPLVPNVRELGAQYSVTIAGDDRVAGYDARIVDISPRDPYRYGYRLWLQQGSQLLLRSAVFDAARRPLEQFMFVALDVGAKPSETDLLPTGSIGGALAPADETAVAAKPFWNVVDAPAGFRLVRTQKPTDGATHAEHLVYTDGIASVSIYVEPQADSGTAIAESTVVRGALSIHSLDAGGVRITALGDVPPATVEAMARGVRASAATD
jgi:sigma-E factor negative regulatory protein RseB